MARDPYLVAIDFGSNSIKLAVVKDAFQESEKVQVLALVEKPSAGIKRGIVTNMSEATETLIDIVNEAESIIGLPIRKAIVGIGGMGVTFTNSDGLVIISRPDNEIQEGDIDRVIQDSLTKAFGINNNEIIHVIPKNFAVDNQAGIRYPAGMIGSKLDARTLIVSVETSYLRNFTKVFNQATIEITNQFYTPLATSDIVLTNRQKKAGTILIDIGYSSTSYIIWENEEIVTTGIIPIGGDHITADLAVGLQTTIEMAEEIKRQYLDVRHESDQDIEEVEMYNPDLQINETFRISDIRTFARARVEEIFLYINKELRKIGKNAQLPGGVVIIGGTSSLIGIEDIAKDMLKLPIFKYSFDRNQFDFVPDYNGDPSFVNAIALAAYAMYHAEDMNYSRMPRNQAQGRSQQSSQGSLKDMINKIWPFS